MMTYIVPATITGDMLQSCSVPENDAAEWSAGTAYAAGARVMRAATHSIYERLLAGTTATAPENDSVNWARVGPTNRWAMFDQAVGTSTAATGSISMRINTGQIAEGLALLDLVGVDTITVTIRAGATVIYTVTLSPIALSVPTTSFYDWFFRATERRRFVVLTGLPPFGDGTVEISLSGTDSVSVGTVAIGSVHSIGDVLTGARIGITDYSKKATDDFGVVTVAERGFIKRMTVPVLVSAADLDSVADALARVRAKPAVWVGSSRVNSLVVYGFVKDWSIDIPGMVKSTLSVEIEGLV